MNKIVNMEVLYIIIQIDFKVVMCIYCTVEKIISIDFNKHGKYLLIPQKFPVDVYKGGHVAPVYTFIDGVGNQVNC
jgi:hypothetical protein